MTRTALGRRWRKPAAVFAAGMAMALATSGVALADNIQDDIVDTSSGITLVAGSSSGGTANIRVIGNNADGATTDPQCNWDAGENPLRLDVVTPPGVTATPDPLEITNCGVDVPVTIRASAGAVSGVVTVTIVSTPQGGGGYNNNVSIPVTITRPNTAPTVTVTGVAQATFVVGNEPTPGCSVTDAEQPALSATPSIDRSALVNGLGQVTVTCTVTDAGGLSDTDTAGYTIVPRPNTPPTVTVTGINATSYEVGSEPTAGCLVTDTEEPGLSATPSVDRSALDHGLGQVTVTCSVTDAGGLSDSDTASYTVVDTGNPTIQGAVSPVTPNGTNGWYKTFPTVTFTCADTGGSGVDSCVANGSTSNYVTLGDGADQSVSGTATDWAGNTATATVSDIDVDTASPTATFNSTIGTVHFGSVPTAPSCTAVDSLSGPAGCVVSGYSTAVGTHTLTATATDRAGNTGTATTTYTVSPWSLGGFYSPVDLNGVWNTVKGGSTVPLKFEVFAASELTSTSAVTSFTQKQVTCPSSSVTTDEVEIVSTGGTSLRYDATGGQFIQNWATPKKPGACFVVIMTTQDGSKASANFTLR